MTDRDLLSRLATLLLQAALVLLLALTGLVLLQLVCRNVWNLGLPWADELARWCGIALVFLAVPRLFLDRRHIAVELLAAALPPRGRRIVTAACEALSLAFCLIMLAAFCIFLSRTAKFATPALAIPNLVFYAPAVLGILLLGAILARRLFAPGPEDNA